MSATSLDHLRTERDWTEDFPHENGNYLCTCMHCNQHFIGHKRRISCRKCSPPLVVLPTVVIADQKEVEALSNLNKSLRQEADQYAEWLHELWKAIGVSEDSMNDFDVPNEKHQQDAMTILAIALPRNP